ncbi:MAG: hypothetical protein OEZ25_02120 [Candidatus Bathyarchaeota archaeon]|nr:hypothetical protein [Candidatus Bathyarchaeota archaeon]
MSKKATWIYEHKYKAILVFILLELFYFILHHIFEGPSIPWLLLAINTAVIGILTIIFHLYIWKE